MYPISYLGTQDRTESGHSGAPSRQSQESEHIKDDLPWPRTQSLLPSNEVGVVFDRTSVSVAGLLPKHRTSQGSRAWLTGSLLSSSGALFHCKKIAWDFATEQQLSECHSDAYIRMLLSCDTDPGLKDKLDGAGGGQASKATRPNSRTLAKRPPALSKREEFGLVDDCPPFPGVHTYASGIAGMALGAARFVSPQVTRTRDSNAGNTVARIAQPKGRVGVCFFGGRHHAGHGFASGFCYLNDCALAVLALQSSLQESLDIQLELHEQAVSDAKQKVKVNADVGLAVGSLPSMEPDDTGEATGSISAGWVGDWSEEQHSDMQATEPDASPSSGNAWILPRADTDSSSLDQAAATEDGDFVRSLQRDARVLYVDIDVHHADGVEGILQGVPNCYCLSVHHRSKGFYPGSGALRESCGRKGVMNVPIQRGCTDAEFCAMLLPALRAMVRFAQPDGIVLQAGCDGLGQDPTAAWNLTHVSYRAVVNWIVRLGLPTVILGGGGYKHTVASRCNAHILDAAIGACKEHPLADSDGRPSVDPASSGWSCLPSYVIPTEKLAGFKPSAAEMLMSPAADAVAAGALGSSWACSMQLCAIRGRQSMVRPEHLARLKRVLEEQFGYGADEELEDQSVSAGRYRGDSTRAASNGASAGGAGDEQEHGGFLSPPSHDDSFLSQEGDSAPSSRGYTAPMRISAPGCTDSASTGQNLRMEPSGDDELEDDNYDGGFAREEPSGPDGEPTEEMHPSWLQTCAMRRLCGRSPYEVLSVAMSHPGTPCLKASGESWDTSGAPTAAKPPAGVSQPAAERMGLSVHGSNGQSPMQDHSSDDGGPSSGIDRDQVPTAARPAGGSAGKVPVKHRQVIGGARRNKALTLGSSKGVGGRRALGQLLRHGAGAGSKGSASPSSGSGGGSGGTLWSEMDVVD